MQKARILAGPFGDDCCSGYRVMSRVTVVVLVVVPLLAEMVMV
jgi:hypothetical protein